MQVRTVLQHPDPCSLIRVKMKVNFNASTFDLTPLKRVPNFLDCREEEKTVSYK